jgi:hypothetical protein
LPLTTSLSPSVARSPSIPHARRVPATATYPRAR